MGRATGGRAATATLKLQLSTSRHLTRETALIVGMMERTTPIVIKVLSVTGSVCADPIRATGGRAATATLKLQLSTSRHLTRETALIAGTMERTTPIVIKVLSVTGSVCADPIRAIGGRAATATLKLQL